MKIFKYLTLILIPFALLSCGPNNEDKAKVVAQDFLTAYLSTDFNKASSFCTSSLADKLKESTDEINNLNAQLKDHIINTANKYEAQIEELKMKGNDTTIITYIIKNKELSISSDIKSSMLLVKEGKDGWKICRLGNQNF